MKDVQFDIEMPCAAHLSLVVRALHHTCAGWRGHGRSEQLRRGRCIAECIEQRLALNQALRERGDAALLHDQRVQLLLLTV